MKPEIRFNGFIDEWVEKKLGEILKERKVTQQQSNDAPLVSFTVEKGVTPKTDRYDREGLVTGDKDAKRYKLTLLDDIVYNPANLKFGAISRNKFGKAVFSPIYVTYFQNDDDSDMRFMEMIVTSDSFIKHVRKYEQGTVYERQSVSSSDMLKAVIQLPTLPEQQKIGALFSKYDAIIGLREQKLEELNALKKGLLQQMFPKDGAKVPELRFAGFADEWVEKKLGEIGLIQTGNTPSTSELANYSEDGLIWITPTDITSSYVTNSRKRLSKIGEKKSRIAETGSILVTSIASIGKNTIVIERAAFNQQINALTPTSKNDSYFLLAQSKEWSDRMKNIASKGTMDIVNKSTFSNIRVYVPTLPEQQKIGQLFKHLDARISNEQSKIEQLKDQKQGLLQRML